MKKIGTSYVITAELRGAERAWAAGEFIAFLTDYRMRTEADAWLDGRRVLRYEPDTGQLICMPLEEI